MRIAQENTVNESMDININYMRNNLAAQATKENFNSISLRNN